MVGKMAGNSDSLNWNWIELNWNASLNSVGIIESCSGGKGQVVSLIQQRLNGYCN